MLKQLKKINFLIPLLMLLFSLSTVNLALCSTSKTHQLPAQLNSRPAIGIIASTWIISAIHDLIKHQLDRKYRSSDDVLLKFLTKNVIRSVVITYIARGNFAENKLNWKQVSITMGVIKGIQLLFLASQKDTVSGYLDLHNEWDQLKQSFLFNCTLVAILAALRLS